MIVIDYADDLLLIKTDVGMGYTYINDQDIITV